MEKKLTDSGAKAYQRDDENEEDSRAKVYMDWHRDLDSELLMADVDSIEWRYKQGKLTPVAVIELTRIDEPLKYPDNYLKSILERFEKRDMQGKAVRIVAAALNVPAYITLFQKDLDKFWVYSLQKLQWREFNKTEYIKFLHSFD